MIKKKKIIIYIYIIIKKKIKLKNKISLSKKYAYKIIHTNFDSLKPIKNTGFRGNINTSFVL